MYEKLKVKGLELFGDTPRETRDIQKCRDIIFENHWNRILYCEKGTTIRRGKNDKILFVWVVRSIIDLFNHCLHCYAIICIFVQFFYKPKKKRVKNSVATFITLAFHFLYSNIVNKQLKIMPVNIAFLISCLPLNRITWV